MLDRSQALALLTQHGGNKSALCELLGIDEGSLLDLSSAVSPHQYPLPEIPARLLAELPYESAELREIAAAYYGVHPQQVLACAGSQAAIQVLPRLRTPSKVLLPQVGYAEHKHWWEAAGHHTCFYDTANPDHSHSCNQNAVLTALQQHQPDVLVLIHPNNPTADYVSENDLELWRQHLPANGQIVIDEAFIDPTPERSLAYRLDLPGLVVLRSVGKFFGLPGLRLGFVLADPGTLRQMRAALGPWPVSALAQWAGCRMLADTAWQQAMLPVLATQSHRQARQLSEAGYKPAATPLFTSLSLSHEAAAELALHFLQRGIALRYYHQHSEKAWLRLGLAADSAQTAIARALADIQEGLPRRAI